MLNDFPPEVKQLFWGDNLAQLDWSKHKDYITQTILEKGDFSAVSWLFKHRNKNEIKNKLNHYHLSPKSSNFWRIYLS